jgi:hypothetical protein
MASLLSLTEVRAGSIIGIANYLARLSMLGAIAGLTKRIRRDWQAPARESVHQNASRYPRSIRLKTAS